MKSVLLLLLLAANALSQDALEGQWSLNLPNQEAGWLAVEDGRVSLLWAVGSARPVEKFTLQNGVLQFEKALKRPLAPPDEPATSYGITLTAQGDVLNGEMLPADANAPQTPVRFTGQKQPPMPQRPDLTKMAFGEPISLFNGRDLAGWKISRDDKKNGWSARDGLLCNDTPKTDFSAYGDHANLRTEAEFEDFQLHLEYRLPAGSGGNSGIHLRGLYEVQVTHKDSKMQGINDPGAVFGRVAPTRNAGHPAGEWDTLDITLADRHITVVLNGETVIDNAPVPGCTGGALHSDVTRPGPIYLQGDHTSVQYRHLTLRPRVK